MSKHIKLPPIRQLLKPDPGYQLFDCDLSGADAQVVAWEANETELKNAFRAGVDIHNFNGKRLWGSSYDPKQVRRKLTWRDECKRGVHGTTYLSGVQGLARALGWPLSEVSSFQLGWFSLNPGIRLWHRRIEYNLQTTRRVENKFGYRIIYFDRPSNALPKAVAWIPQSTVGIVCATGAVRLHNNLPWLNVLLQVHDSVVFQIPFHRVSPSSLKTIRDHLAVTVPYPNDPLIIPWGLKSSQRSWGHLSEKLDWDTLEEVKKAA